MEPKYKVVFFKTESGNEPLREWLSGLSRKDRKTIGEDIKTVQFSWPLGMPLIKKVGKQLWEVRSNMQDKIARVIFTIYEGHIVLLHGFIKKSQKIPTDDLRLANKRMLKLRG